ncbi:MAG: hypothetical protein HUU22_08570 [Phycisphaerae bacterium]|nr:hypothetical protein [Phycisphaerae bacterium]NUQ46073.1 hypothetical protein [Phycisphaerae bacterium]
MSYPVPLSSSRKSADRRAVLVSLCMTSLAVGASGAMCGTFAGVDPSLNPAVAPLLTPAPTLPKGFYDHFGTLRSPAEARRIVEDAGLDPDLPAHYARLGLVYIDDALLQRGRDEFFAQVLGDPFTLGSLINFANAFGKDAIQAGLDSFDPAKDPDGHVSFLRDLFTTIALRPKLPTTNLWTIISRDLRIGSKVWPAGSIIETGADVAAGELIPVGFEGGTVSCSLCHASVDPISGRMVPGAPNVDLNIGLFVALSSNTSAVFLRLNHREFDPFDPRFPRTGRRIIDSNGATVQLPDPVAFERAVDDFILTIPRGGFEAAPDGVTAVTKIPDSFVFGEGGMGWDGGFQIGPFGGVAAFSNAVHTFEVNMLGPGVPGSNGSRAVAGLDPEVYLGMVLQNASDPSVRISDDVKPSEWLAVRFPDAEQSRAVRLPSFPKPTLFSLNSLVFSPGGEPFMYAINALAAFQSSLTVPPNRSLENLLALQTGAVTRGAEVFAAANCTSCHPPPFFTTGRILSNDVLKGNAARGRNRRVLEGNLIPAMLPSFDQTVPLPPQPNLIALPPDPLSPDTVTLPPGLDTDAGGYKISGLLGLYLKAPYLHDGGVAVAVDAVAIASDGGYRVIRPSGLGVPGTLKIGVAAHPGHSLRALLDRQLRELVVAANRQDADLVRGSVEGTGHEFFVDPAAGFSYQQQSDLISFLLALDDNPAAF